MNTQTAAQSLCRTVIAETNALYISRVKPRLEELGRATSDPKFGPGGYEVLFGPPLRDAELFIVGFQPGGAPGLGDLIQPADRDPPWPSRCAYAEQDWRLARELRSIFGQTLLEHSTGSNRQFFRAASDSVYRYWPLDLRAETQTFSLRHLTAIIEALQPKRILSIGKTAHWALDSTAEVTDRDERGTFLLGAGHVGTIPVLSCAHLTGRRLTTQSREKVQRALRRFVGLPNHGADTPAIDTSDSRQNENKGHS